jgi:hypothetical protein
MGQDVGSRGKQEMDRLREVWRTGWSESPLENLFVLAFWSVAQYDGLRAAAWIGEILGYPVGEGDHSRLKVGLSSIVEAYSGCVPSSSAEQSPPVDLYVSLQLTADSIQHLTGGVNPLDQVEQYRPRPLW